jgi:hypothetical protein
LIQIQSKLYPTGIKKKPNDINMTMQKWTSKTKSAINNIFNFIVTNSLIKLNS